MSSLSAVTFNVDKPSFTRNNDYVKSIVVFSQTPYQFSNKIQEFNLQHAGEDQWSFEVNLAGLLEETQHNHRDAEHVKILLQGKLGGNGETVRCQGQTVLSQNTNVDALDHQKIVTFSYPVGSTKPTCIITNRQ